MKNRENELIKELNLINEGLKKQIKTDSNILSHLNGEYDKLKVKRDNLVKEKESLEMKNSVDPIELMDITIQDVKKERNKVLKDYNEIKDLADMMISQLADCMECPVSRILRELEMNN